MCGICGYIDFKTKINSKNNILKMNKSLSHRGPDGEGTWIYKNIAFGHKRLSIVDLSKKAKQPMISNDGNIIINYNGEIYNFFEIKKKLIKKGYKFISHSDTEVFLNAWHCWGKHCLVKFNGMFACVIYNKKENKIFLMRDRFGCKPLYYTLDDKYFIFGSEQKAILSFPFFKDNIDKVGLVEYFTFQNFFSNRTFLENIKLFPAGSVGEIDLNIEKKILNIKKFWDFNFNIIDYKISYEDYQKETLRLLKNSIKLQINCDVELGSYLSGGIDSSLIVAIASKMKKNFKTFTCGFNTKNVSEWEISFNETFKSKEISEQFNTNHFQKIITPKNFENSLKKISYHLEEPRVGQSYPNYFAAKLASNHCKVVFSGVGADEIFGGYPWRYMSTEKNISHKKFIDNYYLKWKRLLSNSDLIKLMPKLNVENINTKEIFSEVFRNISKKKYNNKDCLTNSLYLESKTFLHGLLLVEDKLGMAHSIETRFPYLDNSLVDFISKCPLKYRIPEVINFLNENELATKTNFKRVYRNKLILRKLSSKYFKKNISKSKKQGFSSPDYTWFKKQSKNLLLKFLNKKKLLEKYINNKKLKVLFEDHLFRSINRRLFIWSIFYSENYLKNLKKYKIKF